eukprot:12925428-Prorocentrum_lima.AAC.1
MEWPRALAQHHRLLTLAAESKGGFYAINAWLFPSHGLSGANIELLAMVVQFVKQLDRPWMLLVDFNMEPTMLSVSDIET